MKFLQQSVTTKLLLLFLTIGISTVLIIGAYSFYSARKAIMQRTMDQLISVRTFKKQQLELFFEEQFRSLTSLSALKSEALSRAEIPEKFYRIIEKEADTGIRITDLFYKKSDDSIPVILIYKKVKNSDPGSPYFVIREISALSIAGIMLNENSKSGLGNSGEAYLVGQDNLMRSESRFIKGSLLKIPVKTENVRLAHLGKTGVSITKDYRGVRVLSAYEPVRIGNLRWSILAEIDYEEAMVPVQQLRNDILLVSLVISFFILGFAQLISKMVTEPIIRLKNAAVRLGKGDFDFKVPVTSTDEIGMLAETFNTMSEQLKDERTKRLIALYDGQEIERKRVSQELHDGLGQKLIGAKLQIENCDESDQACLQKTVSGTKQQLRVIVEDLRRISNDLMPSALLEIGLEAAVRNLCNDVKIQSQIETECDISLTGSPDDQTSVFLFRICQEGIQNILKHAGASRISVQILSNRDSLILMMEDDGFGFDTGTYIPGNGLINMKERSLLLGGTFTIESESGKGTTIRVKIPVNRS